VTAGECRRTLRAVPIALALLALSALPSPAKSLDQLREQAYALEQRGDCARAYPLFVAAAAQSGGAAGDHLAAAYCAAALKRNEDAIARFRLALGARDPLPGKERAAAWAGLAYALEAAGKWQEAARAWDEALALERNDAHRLGAARAWKAAGDAVRARKLYDDIDPARLPRNEQAEFWSEKAELLAASDPAGALAAIERAIAASDGAGKRVARAELLLKLGRTNDAIAELEAAHRLDPTNAETALALAYAYQQGGRAAEAAAMFEAASRANPGASEALEDWGYALMAAGRYEEAVEKFKRSLDAATSAAPQAERARKLWDMRRQIHALEKDYFLNAYATYRSDAGGSTVVLPGDPRRLQSAAGFQLGWITPLGLLGEHNIAVTGGAYFAFRDDPLVLDRDSPQASVGLRWQPFVDDAFFVSLDRLIALGDNARDGWLTSVSFSGGEGTEWDPSASQWTFASIEATASYIWDAPAFLSATAEARLGPAFGFGDMWMFVPHFLLSGDFEDDDGVHSSLVETGAGVSLLHWFCSDHYEGPLCATQFTAQYRYVLAQEGLTREDSSVVAQFSLGF
jgi:tetratricopeptide (TPR) repeat protein